jgi:N-acetylglucosamine-6-phosphate deacetylase
VQRGGDGGDRVLVPGFVDLQVNGIDDVDVASAEGEDWERLDQLLLAQGVTSWCPTLVTAPLDAFGPRLDRIAAAAARPRPRRPDLVGAHLEGPFLGGSPGAHPPELLVAIDLDWLAGLPAVVRVVTLAPELDRATEAVRLLTDRGVVASLGHSAATYDEAAEAVDAGARLVTHLFNGMGPLHHRRPGLAGCALADDRVFACLIADLVHVHPAVLRAAFRAKGAHRVVAVTDSVGWRAARIGRIEIGLGDDGVPRLADGTLAGSVLTMDGAVRNLTGAAGLPLEDVVRAASTNPAAVLGLDDRGALAVGKRADVVVLRPDLTVAEAWVGGERAWVGSA